MPTLAPKQAAAIATGVYNITNVSVSDAIRLQGPDALGCRDLFAVSDPSRFKASSGALAWREITGFGLIADGVGPFQNEVLIATRGTQSTADWLSNLAVATESGPGGLSVHQGFNHVYKSYARQITDFLGTRRPATIHCVGHSLGGALATLNADMLSQARVAPVKLYTFGSPRVGLQAFTESLTARLGAGNIYRVHHSCDPVPKVPIFPFRHVPASGSDYRIDNGNHALLAIPAHLMPSYIAGVGDRGWADLAAHVPPGDAQVAIANWLSMAGSGRAPILMGSAIALDMISRALVWILRRASGVSGWALGLDFAGNATLADRIAMILFRGGELSAELLKDVGSLTTAIFQFLGRPVVKGANMTREFLAWVLDLLFHAMQSLAVGAVQAVTRL